LSALAGGQCVRKNHAVSLLTRVHVLFHTDIDKSIIVRLSENEDAGEQYYIQ